MKINKKFLTFGVIGLFAVMLVSAGVILHYTQVQQEINVNSPITITGLLTPEVIEGLGTGYFLSTNLVTAENIAPFDVNVNVNSVVTTEEPDGTITTSYVNKLRLSQKVVAFGFPNWDEVAGTDLFVEYTVVGDTLLAEVVGEGLTGYELIYYADNADRFNNVAKAVSIEEVDASLPYEGDANAEGYDYCTEEESYNTC
ncbi:MAG: hypothetical protein KKB88_01115, partial [Nanoarchaeota archaeon]|nr:hypothetical protein [Nanoarchaeota archaeon]